MQAVLDVETINNRLDKQDKNIGLIFYRLDVLMGKKRPIRVVWINYYLKE